MTGVTANARLDAKNTIAGFPVEIPRADESGARPGANQCYQPTARPTRCVPTGAIDPMKGALKRLAAVLPARSQQAMKRLFFARQVRGGTFSTDEPEYAELDAWLRTGDWVVDVGANVGHYTHRFARLVGDRGRVIAFEPQPQSFELLTANLQAGGLSNVTLFNAAASERTALVHMTVPTFETGLKNYYMARLSEDESNGAGTHVLSIAIDALDLPQRVALIKIDAEGHEMAVLRGMQKLLRRDRPRLIVEVSEHAVTELLESMGYVGRRLPGSPNHVFESR